MTSGAVVTFSAVGGCALLFLLAWLGTGIRWVPDWAIQTLRFTGYGAGVMAIVACAVTSISGSSEPYQAALVHLERSYDAVPMESASVHGDEGRWRVGGSVRRCIVTGYDEAPRDGGHWHMSGVKLMCHETLYTEAVAHRR